MTDIVTRDGYDYIQLGTADRLALAGVPAGLRDCTWASWDWQIVPDGIRKRLKWLMTWDRKDKHWAVILCAPVGRGKTHIAVATLARVVMSLGPSAGMFLSWPSLVRRVADSWVNGGEGLVLGPVKDVPVLVIDDFGAEGAKIGEAHSWVRRIAYELIDSRYVNGQKTLITTNLTANDISQRLDERIMSRLNHDGVWIDMSGLNDWRRGNG